MLELHYPYMLLGLLIVAPFGVALLFVTKSQTKAWTLYTVVLPLLAAVFAILAATGPAARFASSAKRIIVALDDSPAAVTAPWRQGRWLRGFLTAHSPHGVPITLVTFASRPHVLATQLLPQNVPDWPIARNEVSRRRASTKRLLAFSGSTPVWIFTTGLLDWHVPSPGAVPQAALAATVIPPTSTDVGITGLRWVFGGGHTLQSPRLQVTLRSTGPGLVRLMEMCGSEVLAQLPVRFHNSEEKMVLLPPIDRDLLHGHQTFTVKLLNHDLWPGDNSAEILLPEPALPRVLIITPKQSGKTGQVPGWISQILPPGQFPVSPATLERYQAVVLDNVPVTDLRPQTQKRLSAYVTNIGGGLLIAGTRNAFGPGGYGLPLGAGNTPSILETLSPLSSVPPHPRPLHVLFLMDVSGSLGNATASGVTRFALAAHAVCAAVQLLRPKDHITILLFSGQTRSLITGEVQTVRPVLAKLLAKIVPNGPTRPNSALPILRRLLTKKALLIVVTDGRIPHLNVPAWKDLLERHAVEFAVAAPGHSSRATEQLIAATGTARLPMQRLSQWSRVLRMLIQRRIQGTPNRVEIAWKSRVFGLQSRTNLWDRVYLKRRATLVAHGGQYPLAALWRRGLGQVGAICFSDNSTPARILYTSLLNMVKAPRGNPDFHITAQRRNGRWFLAVRAASRGKFCNQLHLNATAIQQNGKLLILPLPQIAPGQYGAGLPRHVHAFSATVSQLASHSARQRETIIGRIQAPGLPNEYFPATGRIKPCPWPAATLIPGNAPSAVRWQPMQSTQSFHFAVVLWILALLSALTAIFFAARQSQTAF